MRAALLRLRRTTGLPVAFGGLLGGAHHFRIAELSGTSTDALRGLAVSTGNGLGGKSIALSRPCAVLDYRSSLHISHEYDTPVTAEGLRAVLAVPVVVRRKVRGVLYGALRTPTAFGDRTFGAAVEAARDVEQSLLVRDEAERLLAAAREPVCGADAPELIRETRSALRALAPHIVDPLLRDELLAVCGWLAPAPPTLAPVREVVLAPREVDVLTWVAAGATNAVTGEALGLKAETVKGYLRSAMRKLGAHSRTEAVAAARRAGLLP
ncbi:response regulator transcription factor [Streptomyces sp. NBC_01465]|uniref:response regulator transcription factor n=1 Tax=Streptomyces sp. NBC_01465 TaxID=2903878 RepID=UPI002E3799B6|nr:LuxR C-terminal-related transcriptional regulator [Streptomyces sp. NBC_01465]